MFVICVDYFNSNKTFQVMLYNKKKNDTVPHLTRQNLDFNRMFMHVLRLRADHDTETAFHVHEE